MGRFGSYEVLGELAKGGMGVVYRARDLHTGREVALKTLLRGKRSEVHRLRFLREGELTAALEHPGILRVHACGEEQGIPWLAYELVEGCRELDAAWRALPREGRVELVWQAARAVGHAHAAGVVHRDIKPGNVLVDAHGRVRVADFGLAAGAGLEHLTRTGEVVGTPTHMAPEQLTGEGAREPSVDVWALGILLYQALTDTLPHTFSSLLDLTHKLHFESIEPPRQRDPSVPAALEAVCLRALERDPAQRYPDAATLAADLERALRGEPPRVRRGRPRPALAGALLGLGVFGALLATWVLRAPDVPARDPASHPTRAAAAEPTRAAAGERARGAAGERARGAAGEPSPAKSPPAPPTGERSSTPAASQDPTDPAGPPPRAFPNPDHFVIASLLDGAAHGLAGSMHELGEVWRAGLYDVPIDAQAAIYWYRRSEAAGNPQAATRVTKILLDTGDDAAFLPLNRLQQGSEHPEVARAAHLQYHTYLTTRRVEDAAWFEAGRAAGCGLCQHVAAQELDGPARLDALERAATTGSVQAILELAEALRFGRYGPADPDRAAEWYQRLANREVVEGMVRLAELQLSGTLRQSDRELARHWLEVATRLRNPEARELLHEHFPD